jgi:stage III sporulation protein AE
MISILVIITLMAILKSLELDSDSSVNKVIYLVSFLVITSILIITYKDMISMFISSINLMTKVVQAVSPFVMAILMATGCITTTGIIQPIILFMASAIGVVVNYVIIPVLVISLVLKILSSMSDFINLNKFASVISKTAMWITGIAFTLMLGILGIDSSIGTSVDSVTVKTAQTAVSSTIPVVGKFVSDSLEVIMGSAEVIGKVAGTVGIVALILVMLNPIIKIIVLILIYLLLVAFAESLGADKKIVELIESFFTLYKTMLGVLIGVMSIFLISIAIMMSLMGKVTS